MNYGQSYGEWAEPAAVFPNDRTNVLLPHPEESTAYTAFIMGHMAEFADCLGKPEDKALFEEYRDGCRDAYRQLIALPGYTLDTDRQAKLVRPLYMRLLDEKQTDFAEKRLVKAMENYGWRLGTGFLSMPFILDVLAGMDIEYAYRLLENEEMPGWLFQTMCGIRVDGENHFTSAPAPADTSPTPGQATRAFAGWWKAAGKRTGINTRLLSTIPLSHGHRPFLFHWRTDCPVTVCSKLQKYTQNAFALFPKDPPA